MPVGLRHLGRSAIQPPASFAKLERPSETPSITPSAKAGAPRLARNAGRIEVAASWPQSEKRLASPIPITPGVSQRFGKGDKGALEGSLMLVTGITARLYGYVVLALNPESDQQLRSLFYEPNWRGLPGSARSRERASC